MWPRLEPRGETSRLMLWLTPLIAVGVTVAVGAALFAVLGFAPLATLYAFFVEPLTTGYGIAEVAVKATPLALIAVGLALGYRANVWNIGAEGQLTVGAICGGGVALAFWGEDAGAIVLPLMLVAGTLGGMAWAAIPAFLRTRFNANEILTSLMLVYVATLLLNFLVHGPWRDPEGYNFPQSRLFDPEATLPIIWEGTRLHIGILIALAVAVGGWVLLARGYLGFQIKVLGLAPRAAQYAGFSRDRLIWLTMLGSGALAGLAGVIEVSGPLGQLMPSVSPGYGFTAIIVAFLGRLHPAGIVGAAALVALSYIGGETAQITLRVPLAVVGVFQGLLLFVLLAVDVLVRYRIRFRADEAAA